MPHMIMEIEIPDEDELRESRKTMSLKELSEHYGVSTRFLIAMLRAYNIRTPEAEAQG